MPIATPPSVEPASAVGQTYTTRLLPIEEWDRLLALPFGTNGLPNPDFTIILVTETAAGEIIAVWAILTAVHLDGAWIHPDHRGTTVVGRMVKLMKATLRRFQLWDSFTIVNDPAVMIIAHKVGFVRAPGDLWVMHLTSTDELESTPPKDGD